MTFPASIPSFTNPDPTDTLDSPSHSDQHGSANDNIVGLAEKVGSGASTPTFGKALIGTGTGTSAWGDPDGTLHKWDATGPPGVGDDSGDGYSQGSIWYDTITGDKFLCVDASSGAAVWDPFDGGGGGGGADLSAYRLPSVSDDPGDIALGAFGDEFEYADQSAFDASDWVARSGTYCRVLGSSIDLHFSSSQGKGILLPVSGFGTGWEVAFLVQLTTYACGIALVDSSGNGMATFRDGGGSVYLGNLSAYSYSGDRTAVSSSSAYGLSGVPFWIAVRKSGTSWRYRTSPDGVTWTTLFTNTNSFTPDRVGWMSNYGPPNAFGMSIVHRMVYGDPDLGL